MIKFHFTKENIYPREILTMVPIIVNIDIQITTAIMVGFTTSIITVALVMFGQIELKIIEYSKHIIIIILKHY